MNYKKIVEHLKAEEEKLKELKYNRPYRRLSKGHLAYREQLNVVRFLNMLVIYKKYNGERSPLDMLKKKSYYAGDDRNMIMIISGFYCIRNNKQLLYKSGCNTTMQTIIGDYDIGFVSHREFFVISDIIDDLTGSNSENYESTIELFKELKEWSKNIYR